MCALFSHLQACTICVYLELNNNQSMITKAWTYLTQRFYKKQQTQPTVILPFQRPQPMPRQMPKLNFSLSEQKKDNKDSRQVDFKVVVRGEEEFVKQLKGDQEELSQEVIDDVRELNEMMRQMTIQEKRLQEVQRKTNVFDPTHAFPQYKPRPIQKNANELRREYELQILQFRQCKYTKQLPDFPLIPFQSFQRILLFWRDKKRSNLQIKRTKLQSVEKLTFKAMGGIDHGQWLNDDVINMTIQMMEKRLPQEGVKLLNSFFATTILPKTENMINRYLKKKAIDRSFALIMPINDKNHWYFAKFDPNTLTLTVYDSLRKRPEIYLDNPIFKNALKFGKGLYGVQLTLLVSEDYPQQNNGYDCGVFMLMGIRDSLTTRQWSFRQGDMRFKRIQLACQVYEEELMLGEGVAC